MAQIIGLKEQQDALKKIKSLLNSLTASNLFLETDNPENLYEFTFSIPHAPEAENENIGMIEDNIEEGEKVQKKRKRKTIQISAPAFSQNKAIIDELVMNHKKNIVDEILELAEKYNIELDDADKKILGIEKMLSQSH